MTATQALKVHVWPDFTGQFDCNGLALIALPLPENTRRQELREAVRSVLNRLLKERYPHVPQLVETPLGPEFPGIKISLSYAGSMALIALSLKYDVGVDVVSDETPAEAVSLQALYFPATFHTRYAGNFAAGWAALEASCKALKLPLAEIIPEREAAYAVCDLIACEQIEGYRIAFAVVGG